MATLLETVDTQLARCGRCGEPLGKEDQFCSGCGADRALELEIAAFHGPALAAARKWILAVGILYVVSAVLLWLMSGARWSSEMAAFVLGSNVGLALVHVGLWAWAKKAPLAAAVVALGLFVTLQLVGMVMDPSNIYKGIIIKVIFVVVLLKAVSAGIKIQKLRAQRA